jgi:type IX secretion system PorP/SprF family membrane protein
MQKIVGFIVLGWCNLVMAQQESLYTQYMYNTMMVNPAYTGSSDLTEVFALHRNQWVGFEGAPKTYNFALSVPLENTNFAIGINFLNESIGPTLSNNIAISAAYHLPISEKYKLAIGLQSSINIFDFDQSKLNIFDPTDVRLQNFTQSTQPNVGAGLYLYSNQFYFGVSIPHFLASKLYDDNNINVYQNEMNWYAITGYVFNLSNSIKAKPAVLFKSVTGAPYQLDLSANLLFHEKLTTGISYRLNASWNAMAGFQITPQLFAGYGYDLQSTQLINYNSGSHEIFLKYSFQRKQKRIFSPRFF